MESVCNRHQQANVGGLILLYDASSVANSPINTVYIIRVTSVSILEVCMYREDLTDSRKGCALFLPTLEINSLSNNPVEGFYNTL